MKITDRGLLYQNFISESEKNHVYYFKILGLRDEIRSKVFRIGSNSDAHSTAVFSLSYSILHLMKQAYKFPYLLQI